MKARFADGLTVPGTIDPKRLKQKLVKYIEDTQDLNSRDIKYDEGSEKFKVFYSISGDEVTINRIVSR